MAKDIVGTIVGTHLTRNGLEIPRFCTVGRSKADDNAFFFPKRAHKTSDHQINWPVRKKIWQQMERKGAFC